MAYTGLADFVETLDPNLIYFSILIAHDETIYVNRFIVTENQHHKKRGKIDCLLWSNPVAGRPGGRPYMSKLKK